MILAVASDTSFPAKAFTDRASHLSTEATSIMTNTLGPDLRAVAPGLFPAFHDDDLKWIRHRIHLVLETRTTAECQAASEGVFHILHESEDIIVDQYMLEEPEVDPAGRFAERMPLPHMLLRYIELFDISGQADFPHARWSEYFATLGAEIFNSGIDLAKKHKQKIGESDTEDQQFVRLGRTGFCFRDAAEAVTIAEQLIERERQDSKRRDLEQKKVSLQARLAAKARHGPLDALKQECVAFYEAHDFRSYAEAARRFWATVDDQRKNELRLREPQRVLKNALYEHAKSLKR